jgi:hypothetical protein
VPELLFREVKLAISGPKQTGKRPENLEGNGCASRITLRLATEVTKMVEKATANPWESKFKNMLLQ